MVVRIGKTVVRSDIISKRELNSKSKLSFFLNYANILSRYLFIQEITIIFVMNMCDNIMKCKTKALFISIALSFLIGCLSKVDLYPSETGEMPFGTLAETVYFYDYILDLEGTSVSQHEISPEINVGDAIRHFSKTKRINSPSSFKTKIAFIKKKANNITNTTFSLFESFKRFPSGLTQARKHLISLGILII